jgi:hypothetical protein
MADLRTILMALVIAIIIIHVLLHPAQLCETAHYRHYEDARTDDGHCVCFELARCMIAVVTSSLAGIDVD